MYVWKGCHQGVDSLSLEPYGSGTQEEGIEERGFIGHKLLLLLLQARRRLMRGHEELSEASGEALLRPPPLRPTCGARVRRLLFSHAHAC